MGLLILEAMKYALMRVHGVPLGHKGEKMQKLKINRETLANLSDESALGVNGGTGWEVVKWVTRVVYVSIRFDCTRGADQEVSDTPTMAGCPS